MTYNDVKIPPGSGAVAISGTSIAKSWALQQVYFVEFARCGEDEGITSALQALFTSPGLTKDTLTE